MSRLTLLDGVAWEGTPIPGDRPAALLAALAAHPSGLADERLVELVWSDRRPGRPAKALQVLVSRVRGLCGSSAIGRAAVGYRLDLDREEVDAWRLADLVRATRDALDAGDPARAIATAEEAARLVPGDLDERSNGPLAALLETAHHLGTDLDGMLGVALSRTGDHARALPRLEAALARAPDDEALLARLLRSEAASRGTPAALARYDGHRRRLREELGTDPGPELRRLHADLLAADRPVRSGVRYDASELLGRDEEVHRLRVLMDTGRVTSIVGPGGLGKTRVAHLLARESTRSRVHFVELVGVTSPDDVVAEVGGALGVRDSVTGRSTLTAAQRKDVRGRVAQHLDQGPTLLVLDNCEHLIEAVAGLVAFLVVTTRDLHVLVTSRTPLNIAAERVFPLAQLEEADAVELFERRARGRRPGASLDHAEVTAVVRQLDGLPLAIELAAARVGAMSVAEIAHRLDDRFALLRGGDRAAPDRHQTLLAVIEWSWNLLSEAGRLTLRRLSVFADGFTTPAAESVLDDDPWPVLQELVDQSLLTVVEQDGGIRYRMLETVREFGRLRLTESGDQKQAEQRFREWAVDFADRWSGRLFGPDQFTAVDAIAAEENNLADRLRRALGQAAGEPDPDPASVVRLLAALAGLWSVRGDHGRVIGLAAAIGDAVEPWTPEPELADTARLALALTVSNTMIAVEGIAAAVRAKLSALGVDAGTHPRTAALVRVLVTVDPNEPSTGEGTSGLEERLRRLAADPERQAACLALQLQTHLHENAGRPDEAINAAVRALSLTRPEGDGPWTAAVIRTSLAELSLQLGDAEASAVHAREALPVLDRLGAVDDATQLRGGLVLASVAEGQLDRAERDLADLAGSRREAALHADLVLQVAHAELALARGQVPAGLAQHREALAGSRSMQFPGLPVTGLEPWLLISESITLSAHAYHAAADDDLVAGRELFDAVRVHACTLFCGDARRASGPPYLDYPVSGSLLFALGVWSLLREDAPVDAAARLLGLADRFAYNRTAPTMAWDRAVSRVEAVAPGALAAVQREYGDRRGPELLDEATRVVGDRFG